MSKIRLTSSICPKCRSIKIGCYNCINCNNFVESLWKDKNKPAVICNYDIKKRRLIQ